jgi:hypothetical protein
VAVFGCRRLKKGAPAVLFLVAVGAFLVVIHPNQKSRFLHTWLPALWVAAGAGLAVAFSRQPLLRLGRLRGAMAALAVGSVALLSSAAITSVGHSPEAGHRGTSASLFDLTDAYLPNLGASQRIAFLSNVPCRALAEATYLERYGRLENTEFPISDRIQSLPELQGHFAAWLNTSEADTVVMIDVPPPSYFYVDVGCKYDVYGKLPELLAQQDRFKLTRTWNLADYGCRVTLWRRDNHTRRFPPPTAKQLRAVPWGYVAADRRR